MLRLPSVHAAAKFRLNSNATHSSEHDDDYVDEYGGFNSDNDPMRFQRD